MHHDSTQAPNVDVSSCRRLWRMVLLRAIVVAANRPKSQEGLSAQAWIERAGEDFRDVCVMAGFPPCTVQKRALARIAQGPIEDARGRKPGGPTSVQPS